MSVKCLFMEWFYYERVIFLFLIKKCKKLFSKLNECAKLGEGVYGEVFKANVCNIDVALKVIFYLFNLKS